MGTYIVACILVITPPGPAVTYLITASAIQGRKAAYRVIPGIFLGGLCSMTLSFAGIGAILTSSQALYTIMKIVGVFYLIYLGIKSIVLSSGKKETAKSTAIKYGWRSGFLITFLNPKSVIFFASFIPQFIDKSGSFLMQISILGAIYLGIGLVNDILYSFFASHISSLLGEKAEKWIALTGGIAMILSALLILLPRKG
jgi:threonine/homoserine/homoserine lactone efflux protein